MDFKKSCNLTISLKNNLSTLIAFVFFLQGIIVPSLSIYPQQQKYNPYLVEFMKGLTENPWKYPFKYV